MPGQSSRDEVYSLVFGQYWLESPPKVADMPTIHWLKREFDYGYDSGNILGFIPNRVRRMEQRKIGGSYRNVFRQAVRPFLRPDSTVLELGPGRGAWSRAILEHIPQGQLITVDFQDVSRWLCPQQYSGRLVCHQVHDNSFSCIDDNSIDFFWSMGVLCHNNQSDICEIMAGALPKIKPRGYACHQYADWNKLDAFGWQCGGVPIEFRSRPDDEIWWPRNNQANMRAICTRAGWNVLQVDMRLLRRDSLVLLQRPDASVVGADR